MKKLLLAILVLMSFITNAQVKASISEDGGWTGLKHKSIHSLLIKPSGELTCEDKLSIDKNECGKITDEARKSRCTVRAYDNYRHCLFWESEREKRRKEREKSNIELIKNL